MKLISWNVNGIRAAVKKGFLDYLDSEKPDILCIQESKEVKFVNLDLPNSMEGLTFDRAAHSCTHPKLTPIKL